MTRLLDFSEPIWLLMVAVLHFVPDEKDPRGVVARYRDALPVGSLVALSHLTADRKPDEMAGVAEAMKKSRDPMYFRSYAEVRALFEGLELVMPSYTHPAEPDLHRLLPSALAARDHGWSFRWFRR